MAVTDIEIRKAKQRDKEWKLTDGGGLYLLIKPSGSKLWKMKFRIEGREQKLSFGAYPQVSLKDARLLRDEARIEVSKGGDPARRKREAKFAAQIRAGHRFDDVAQEFISKREKEGLAPATLKKANWFRKLLQASIGKRPVAEITPQELLATLKKLERKGNYETAKRTRAFASRVFRYAVANGIATMDPAQPLLGALVAPKARHYSAITDPAAFGGLLRAIDGFDGFYVTKFALQIAPHVFVRPGELRHAAWSEMDFEKAVWRIPAEKMKSRREHVVPLSRQVIDLLKQLDAFGRRSDLVFASLHAQGRPISENTLNASLRRMGFGPEEMTSHGFRSTASTLLNESGRWSADAIEIALAHKDSNAVRQIYHRGKHWDERVQMAQWWSDHIDRLRDDGSVKTYEKYAS
jgi:integrase